MVWDTLATVTLNGHLVARTANMFADTAGP